MVDQLQGFIKKAWDWVQTDPYLRSPDYTRTEVGECYHLHTWIPQTKPLYTEYEDEWKEGGPITMWARDNMPIAWVLVVLYVIVIFGIKRFMETRKFIDVRVPQMYWNGLLAIFSIIGSIRMLPFFLADMYYEGKIKAFCTSPVIGFGGGGASALWVCLFIFSKVPELCDTLWIVLNKKPLLFLHWYHHITVLLYCWHSYATRASVGLSFAAINFTVHAFMYSYYTVQNYSSLQLSKAKRINELRWEKLRKDENLKSIEPLKLTDFQAIKDKAALEQVIKRYPEEHHAELRKIHKPPEMRGPLHTKKLLARIAPVITIMQISQMVVGVYVMYTVFPLLQDQTTVRCHTTRLNWVYGLIMYMSYFVLFVVFAFQKYICPKPRAISGQKETKED